jgi:7-keto-8-aminopelargonate synthetase-like enzyme
MTEPEPLQQVDRTYVRFKNCKLSYFAGCDYYRMSSDARVASALRVGLAKYGLNVAASRLTTGNHVLYQELEKALRNFFGAQAALVVGTGYITNLIVCQALAGRFSHGLIDEKSHPSLSDASRFLDCPVLKFKHADPADLARRVERCGPGARLLLMTEGMFSNDGSAAPLKEYKGVLPADAMLLVDDAHGGGVLGKTGKGTLEQTGVSRRGVIQTGTLSKAFGAYGGVILCDRTFRQTILDRSGLFIGHTPLPLPLACAALRSAHLLDQSRRNRLRANAEFVKSSLAGTRFEPPATPGPIIPITPRTPSERNRIKQALLDTGIFPSLIRYPNATSTGYFRFVISSEHTRAQLKTLVDVLRLCL